MDTVKAPLPDGYSAVPAGKIANVVTCLEMLEKPPARPTRPFPIIPWPAAGIFWNGCSKPSKTVFWP